MTKLVYLVWIEQGKVVKECVRRKDYIESNRTRLLVDLNPGNYCVQVRAFSLAGPGPPTKESCFLIEVLVSLNTIYLSYPSQLDPNMVLFVLYAGNFEWTKR